MCALRFPVLILWWVLSGFGGAAKPVPEIRKFLRVLLIVKREQHCKHTHDLEEADSGRIQSNVEP